MVADGKLRPPKGGESVIFAGSDGRRYEKRVDAKGRESEPVCIEDEIPFEVPEGWEWARLGALATFTGGGTPDKSRLLEWRNSMGVYERHSRKHLKRDYRFYNGRGSCQQAFHLDVSTRPNNRVY